MDFPKISNARRTGSSASLGSIDGSPGRVRTTSTLSSGLAMLWFLREHCVGARLVFVDHLAILWHHTPCSGVRRVDASIQARRLTLGLPKARATRIRASHTSSGGFLNDQHGLVGIVAGVDEQRRGRNGSCFRHAKFVTAEPASREGAGTNRLPHRYTREFVSRTFCSAVRAWVGGAPLDTGFFVLAACSWSSLT